MRIVVLGVRGFPNVQGGVESHCQELYPRLVKLGCDVSVFTRTPYLPREQRLAEWKGVKFIHLACPRSKSFEAIVHTFRGVIRARALSPDLIHIHAIGPSLLAPLARALGIKVVMTHHGPDYQRAKWGRLAKAVLRIAEAAGVRGSSAVIAISKGIVKHVEEKFGVAAQFIPNGVNLPARLAPGDTLRQLNIEPGKYVLTACRFVPEKGLHELIAAYQSLDEPPFQLVIAGDADHETAYSRNLKAMAASTPGIVTPGFVSGEPLRELFSNAGLFVLPSHYEGLPIALLEALSYRLPVLVSDIPQHREIPLPPRCFFPAGKVEGLASSLRCRFPKSASGENDDGTGLSRETCDLSEILRETYNWDALAKQTLQVYREATSGIALRTDFGRRQGGSSAAALSGGATALP